MALFTKDLLINLLFLVIMSLIANISIGFLEEKLKLKRTIHTFIAGLAIIGCISFGIQVDSEVIFDLRQIPFIIVGLMEGSFVTLFLLGFTIVVRSFFGGEGIFATVIVYSLLTFLVIETREMYIKGSFFWKFAISLFLSIFSSIVMIISLHSLGYTTVWNVREITVSYILIPAFGMILILLITEGIHRYFHLRKEIFKAEKIQVISNLAASFGHEVRNPICVSKGFLQLLLEDGVSREKKKEYVQTALIELDRAEKIIYNYLTFAKPEFKNKEPLCLQKEIKQAVEMVLPMANMSNVLVHFDYSPSLVNHCLISGERNRLHQCLLNLLKNAIEAMPNGGDLCVDISVDNHSIGIIISDSGVGMTKTQIQRLGEPYFSLKEKGTGLGMMVVFSIVKSMGGTIKVKSEMGKGTTFKLLFPKIMPPNGESIKIIS